MIVSLRLSSCHDLRNIGLRVPVSSSRPVGTDVGGEKIEFLCHVFESLVEEILNLYNPLVLIDFRQ